MRHYSFSDQCIQKVDQVLRTLWSTPSFIPNKQNPADDQNISEADLKHGEKQKSAALLRVNHSGEICAQALYQGQLCTVQTSSTRTLLTQAGLEETAHLHWCAQRLQELDSRTSYLNPLWYVGSFTLGAIAGCFGDRYSLGFVHAVEQQVAYHLRDHLQQLPQHDRRSRAILQQMLDDELQHGQHAMNAGGYLLPGWIETVLFWGAQPMRRIAYWF